MDMKEYHELMREVARLKREHPGQYPTLVAFAERFSTYVVEEHRRMRAEKDNLYGNTR
jgi:ribulose bisphosphate carboxylase small subunit